MEGTVMTDGKSKSLVAYHEVGMQFVDDGREELLAAVNSAINFAQNFSNSFWKQMERYFCFISDAHINFVKQQDCCVCLYSYEDGAELVALPCNHHFHSTCIVKWLKINAICPLCKFNSVKGNENE